MFHHVDLIEYLYNAGTRKDGLGVSQGGLIFYLDALNTSSGI